MHSGQKQSKDFGENSLENYLKEECLSENYQQLSFKYFVKVFSIPKLL